MENLKDPPPVGYHYDHVLKFLMVGDGDVGKGDIFSCLKPYYVDSDDTAIEEFEVEFRDYLFPRGYCGPRFRSTNLLIFGKRVKIDIWNASGQQFSTIIRSYSRGTQGVILVFDITNKYSFMGLDQWLKEIDRVSVNI